ncbi:MBL fold metallo-hydrolase [Streptomyces sp. NPDC008086]|uniref:MBL fold metallo-hydrolase n=1 Tax=Streptomyces sp. NPDC008086 TaxID=3364807 RepID=UPI0036EDA07B
MGHEQRRADHRRGESLLVDTLYDLRLTAAMLDALAPLTVPAPIATVVNTHGNGDHWSGNQLVSHAEIFAARGSVADMRQVGPAEMLALTSMDSSAGHFARRIFGRFDYTGIEPALATRILDGETVLDVPGTEVRLVDVGPAHSAGDTIVHVPQARTAYTGDIVFAGAETVREIRDYPEYVHEQATARFTAGMPALNAARDIRLGHFADLDENERLAVNVHTVHRELDPSLPPPDGPGVSKCPATATHRWTYPRRALHSRSGLHHTHPHSTRKKTCEGLRRTAD